MIKIATFHDIPLIRNLAERSYMLAYRGIHSEQQNRYMFEQMYSEESLVSQMSIQGTVFHILYDDNGDAQGYCAVKPYNGDEHGEGHAKGGIEPYPVIYLDKLYLLPEHKGKGLGRLLVEHIISTAKEQYPDGVIIRLDVNRKNSAQTFYEHLGFVKTRSWDAHIGNGFYMNACTMELTLN